ncbi:hypothetical protein [Streptomyces geranii]|uniref:hypothetical protein n=1 Tax=Streptomyces geranii TaxID=2058923 RepID=UPI000D04512E|nr:hypothetical protein [Streptomyces geranii]
MRRRLTRRIPAATAAVLLAAGLLAGCGGGGDDDGPGIASVAESAGGGGSGGETAAASDKDEVEQAQEFVDCLRGEGLEVEDPDPVTGELNLRALATADTDRDKLMSAFQACQDKAPQSLQDQASQAPDTEQQQKFAQCMRDNGVDMADPGPDGFTPESVPTGDPDFDTALDACRDRLGFGGGS